eukprot:GCRY01001340.1.p1 GENE.GCRY01001340.1~~GCRY01001340.1.p1  ORF type:complete len:404 (-),score=92.04 GCRY01001340.1:107-1318(-)
MSNSNILRNAFAFLIIGTINNLPYSIVLAAAKNLADEFPNGQLGVITFANSALGIVSRGVNAFWLESVGYGIRMTANGLFMLVGLLGVAVSTHVNFVFCVCSVLFVGVSSSFGESVFLGYIRKFQPDLVSYWSSGTGWAGVGGALLYLVFVSFNFSNMLSFLLLTPLVFIYYGAFFLMVKKPSADELNETAPLLNETAPDDQEIVNTESVIVSTTDSATTEKTSEKAVPTETSLRRVFRVLSMVLWFAANLGLVYYFEYLCQQIGAEHVLEKDKEHSGRFAYKHAFVILSNCYQIGVLISRSSLSLVKIPRIGILTVLQAINLALWLAQDYYHFMPIYATFALMFWVGLLGGAMYVNTFYVLLSTDTISHEDRELCINIVTIGINIGIILASLTTIAMDSWMF